MRVKAREWWLLNMCMRRGSWSTSCTVYLRWKKEREMYNPKEKVTLKTLGNALTKEERLEMGKKTLEAVREEIEKRSQVEMVRVKTNRSDGVEPENQKPQIKVNFDVLKKAVLNGTAPSQCYGPSGEVNMKFIRRQIEINNGKSPYAGVEVVD